MSIPALYHLHGIVLPSAVVLSELTDTTPAGNLEILTGRAAGYPEPLFNGVISAKPDVRATSHQIKQVLDTCNSGSGAPYAADLSSGNVDLYYQKAANLVARTGATTEAHLRFRMPEACLYWTRLAARQGAHAEIDFRIKPIFDGTNAPLIPAGSLALAGTPVGAEFYTLGPVFVNGSQISGIDQWTLDPGITTNEEPSDGEVFDTWASLDMANPVLTLSTRNLATWGAYGLLGTSASSVIFYLRKLSSTGPLSNASNVHIKFTATAGLITQDNITGLKGLSNLRIPLQAPNATSNALAVSTASTIG